MKGILENIFLILDLNNFSFSKKEIKDLNDSFEIIFEKKSVGFIGKIKDNCLKNLEKKGDFFVLQLSIDSLLELSYQKKEMNYIDISYLPTIKKDISFFINKNIKFEEILEIIRISGGKFLVNVTLFDNYKFDSSAKPSLSFRLFFQDKEKNFQNDYIEKKIKNILNNLNSSFSIKER